jgi:hypothetical protein
MARRFWHSPAAAKSASSQNVQRLSDQKIKTVLTDLVYRGHGYVGQAMIQLVGRDFRKLTTPMRRLFKRLSSVEPVIGYAMTACDRMNAILGGCSYNLRRLLGIFFVAVIGRSHFFNA